MSNFIERKFKNIKTDEISDFTTIVNNENISIILGEPASGKTYQLKEYSNQHKDSSLFIELVNLEDTLTITSNIDIILIDSIDEALTDFNNPKKLQKKLVEFIQRCKSINPKVKFVITCRFLEWSNIFESSLKDIDKELCVYSILELSTDDINDLLKKKSISQSDFWKFIEENYLESLLKNILVILSIIDKFEEYKTKQITFIDIYNDIAKEYLSKKGEDREEIASDISTNKLFKIASSLATYITFDRKLFVDSTNLSTLASELYKIDGQDIVVDDSKVILNTALFEKKGNGFSFFHQSIQEYLTADFLANRDLDKDTLKKLLSSEMRFYEEFEEVVVYLTNINEKLFNEFVEFDPFIFKRHPNLTKEQQEKLLLSILNKYKVDFSQVWGRWESFEGSTLVKFEKLDNLIEILEKHSTLEEHGYYLMKLLKNNYTTELKEFMFELFEKNLSDKESLNKVIRGNFIYNYELNLSLYEFLQEHNLLEVDTHTFMLSFEAELFSSLYGIKYKAKYTEERLTNKTDIDFNTILPLLDFVAAKSLKYIAPYFLKEDAEIWFQYVVDRYNKYEYEYINWVIFSVLNHCNTIDDFRRIVYTLNEKKIFLHGIDKNDMKLDFQKIKEIFWMVYFEQNILQEFRLKKIIHYYDIKLNDIKEITQKYSIDKYTEKYTYFRIFDKEFDDYLMNNLYMNEYIKEINKQSEEAHEKWELQWRLDNPEIYQKQLEQERISEQRAKYIKRAEVNTENSYNSSKKELSKIEDVWNIFNWLTYKNHSYLDLKNLNKLDEKLQSELNEKYTLLLDIIKNDWINNKLYEEDKFLAKEDSKIFLIYAYMFYMTDEESSQILINNKSLYEKLFWYQYKREIHKRYFLIYTNKYFDLFLNLTIETFQHTNKKEIDSFQSFINICQELNKFNYENLKEVIAYIKNNNIFIMIDDAYEKENLLKILSLDKEAFSYILKLIEQNKLKIDEYFYFLLQLDTRQAMEYYFKVYNNTKREKSLYIRLKNKIFEKIEVVNNYDKFGINSEKIELYKILISSMKKLQIDFKTIDFKYIETILIDYNDFFEEYQTPKGVYSPDIYDDMYHFINKIWEELGNSSKHIEVLNRLENSKNKRFSEKVKYALTKAYEEQRKNRNYSNSYYKKIFDKDERMEKTTINISGTKHNIAIDSKDVKQTQGQELESKSEKWYQKWWFISLSIASIVGMFLWWKFSWLYGGIGFITSFLIVIILFNPKRRFFRIALSVLGLSSISILPKIIGVFNIPENSFFNGVVKFGESIPLLIIIGLLILSGFLFWLDHQENKK